MRVVKTTKWVVVVAAVLLSLGARWPWETTKKDGDKAKSSSSQTSSPAATQASVPAAAPSRQEEPRKNVSLVTPPVKTAPAAKRQGDDSTKPVVSQGDAQKKMATVVKKALAGKPVNEAVAESESSEEEETTTPEEQITEILEAIPKVPKAPKVDVGRAGVKGAYGVSGNAAMAGLSRAQQLQRTSFESDRAAVNKIQDQIRDMLRVNEGLKVQYREQAADIQKIMDQAKIHEQILKELDENKIRSQRAVELLDPKEILRQEKIRLIREQTMQNQAFLDNLKSQSSGAETKIAVPGEEKKKT